MFLHRTGREDMERAVRQLRAQNLVLRALLNDDEPDEDDDE